MSAFSVDAEATETSSSNVSVIDFSQFICRFEPRKFEHYLELRNLVEKLKNGRIVRYVLQKYSLCSALITRLENDHNFLSHFIDGLVNIIDSYESQFDDLANLIEKFKEQAWITNPTNLFSLLFPTAFGQEPGIDFNDPVTVKRLETHYKFAETGQYSELIRRYHQGVKTKFNFASHTGNFKQANIDFLRSEIDTFFAQSQQTQDIPERFLREVLQQGEYEIFLMFFVEAVRRKDELVVESGCYVVTETRNLNLVKTIFDPINGYYSIADPEIKPHFYINYYRSSKDVYDYFSKLWPYQRPRCHQEFDLGETVTAGDYEMFQVNMTNFERPDCRELIEVAATSGSIQIFQDLESRLIERNKSFDYDVVAYFCFSHNCIDLALWLINYGHEKDLYCQYFAKKLGENPITDYKRITNRQLMKETLGL